MSYGQQWHNAKEIADLLPPGTVWSFHITELVDDAVFNIYAPRVAWHGIRILLGIARKADFKFDATRPGDDSYEEYNYGDGLVLSLIHTEEQDGSDTGDAGDAGYDVGIDLGGC